MDALLRRRSAHATASAFGERLAKLRRVRREHTTLPSFVGTGAPTKVFPLNGEGAWVRANLLDGFAVSRTYATDYVRGSLRLFPMHWTMDMGRERFKDEVSDHLPFVASFRVY